MFNDNLAAISHLLTIFNRVFAVKVNSGKHLC